ncbi:molybdate ABC transporter substrate-binding protein [Pedobacter duraquae]|uniref:Molybdate transport system substrate-binding protein n=1 Tax=Pedobacter duraquae TaxID=425511 RepID=A0A4R6IPT0_9SPHI|nr:molybdate ABC transporter substrate-binding protein [Pedobacter duraquae]TDO24310.1 molybdate transport system substrate-binding protein [Pedobacter duraquae]
MRIIKKIIAISTLCTLFHFAASAQPLRIAVAANAQSVIKLLQADFKKRTGIATEAIIGASGKLATQIEHGAPFDVFLSADMEFPELLYKNNLSLTKPQVYAQGSLIICSASGQDVGNWQKILSLGTAGKVAIANPKVAPYGKAAEESLVYYNLMERVRPQLVYGGSISQINTYITTGVVSLGFTTEAFLHEQKDSDKLKWVRVDLKSYKKIEQGMLVLSHAKKENYKAAMKFHAYILSTPAQTILKQNGYIIP